MSKDRWTDTAALSSNMTIRKALILVESVTDP